MRCKTIFLGSLAVLAATTALGQDYLDRGQIRGLPASPAVQVDLNPMMLGLASQVSRSANPAAADLLANVDNLRVRVYSSLENVAEVTESMDEVSADLATQGWQQVVRVQDQDGGDVRVHVQSDGESITGLTAMIVADNEAVFVNIVGMLTAEQISQVVNSVGGGQFLGVLGPIMAPR
jgi:hypothetical protein